MYGFPELWGCATSHKASKVFFYIFLHIMQCSLHVGGTPGIALAHFLLEYNDTVKIQTQYWDLIELIQYECGAFSN